MIVCEQSAVPPALAALLVAGVSPVSAQDTIVQSEIAYYVQTSAGQPTVCGIQFSMVYYDRTYRQAAIAGLKGTLGWIERDGQVGVIFKVCGFDFPNGSPQIFRIPHAYLSARNKAVPITATYPCDGQPMGYCGEYWMSASVDLYHGVIENTLSINFQRERIGLDASLSIDTKSAAMAKPQEYNDFSTCMVALGDRAKRNLKK